MCGAMQELRDEVEQKVMLDSIQSLMKKGGMTAGEAMDALSVSPEKRKQFLPLL